MSTLSDERIMEEVDALEAILMDDMVVKRDESGVPLAIETVIHPSTGNNVTERYVCLTLEIRFTPGYPDNSPEVFLNNPRGLDDNDLRSMHAQIKKKLEDCIGQPVLFELVALVRDNVTKSNLPRGQCAICLFGFSTGDAFLKTQCYHFYHNNCFGNHLIAAEKYYAEEMAKLPNWQRVQAQPYKQTCPVCRCLVEIDPRPLVQDPPSLQSLAATPFRPTPELKAMQQKMAALLAKQVAKGGVVTAGDSGPPPLTITTPSDKDNEAQGTSNSAPAAPKTEAAEGKAKENASADIAEPDSPRVKNGYRGPYRGFNRRGKPGRRGRDAR